MSLAQSADFRYFERQESICSRVRLRANGRNNSQHCCANDVGSCCVRVGSGMQTYATTLNNVGTCSASREGYNPSLCKPCVMRVRGPNNVGRAVQTDPTLLRYASAITEQKKCRELLAEKFDRFQTLRNNKQQHPTTCNRVWKRTQHVTSNNVASVCTGLKTQLWAQTLEFFKATFTKNSDKIKFVDRYPPKIFRATIK